MVKDEFRDIAVREKDRLHTYAAWLLHDVEEARDVAQDALMKLWVHRDSVHPQAVRTWLLRTAHRACIDRIRRRSREWDRSAMACDPSEYLDEYSAATDGMALRGAVGAALARLSPQQRAAVVLREIAGLSYREIGDILGAPLSVVKITLHRAREGLRSRLARCGERA